MPHFRGFTPIGLTETDDAVVINLEEYEAIRLCDLEGFNHLGASHIMNVSRPTFARIYENARRKVAYAFVEGLPIVFEGGKVYYDSDWYTCKNCGCRFNHFTNDVPGLKCALCGSTEFNAIENDTDETGHPIRRHVCVCPSCGYEKTVFHGIPCNHVVCDRCNSRMRRKGLHRFGRS